MSMYETSSGGVVYLLSIETLLRYNQTSVECVATFSEGSSPILTAPVMLLIPVEYSHLNYYYNAGYNLLQIPLVD